MGAVMTYAEMEQLFASEWVLIESPETTPMLEVIRGRVLWHCKDHDEIYRKALELRPSDCAILYTGRIRGEFCLNL